MLPVICVLVSIPLDYMPAMVQLPEIKLHELKSHYRRVTSIERDLEFFSCNFKDFFSI